MMLELKELSMKQKEEIKQLQKDVEQYTYEVENVGFATWAEKEAVQMILVKLKEIVKLLETSGYF